MSKSINKKTSLNSTTKPKKQQRKHPALTWKIFNKDTINVQQKDEKKGKTFTYIVNYRNVK